MTKLISNNKKVYHDFFVIETYEAGIVLTGTEIKSLRLGNCSISGSLCKIFNMEVFVYGMNISHYEKGNIFNVDSMRSRKLLLHKSEIKKLYGTLQEKGYTLIPIKVYFKDGLVKLEIALCKGKKNYDKREDLKKKNIKRNLERNFKGSSIKV